MTIEGANHFGLTAYDIMLDTISKIMSTVACHWRLPFNYVKLHSIPEITFFFHPVFLLIVHSYILNSLFCIIVLIFMDYEFIETFIIRRVSLI